MNGSSVGLRNGLTITARIALSDAQNQFAWRVRGEGYADTVSDDGWRLFEERTKEAAKTLMDAASLHDKSPEWYLSMQLTARDLGQSKELQTAIFEKAIAFEPDYQYFYRAQAESLLPKWEGKEGEMAAFAEEAADRIGGKKGDMIYYQIATYLNAASNYDRTLKGMKWPRIKSGYMAVEEQYGESLENVNAMAFMAGMGGDPVYSDQMFARLGEAWDKHLWRSLDDFHMVREWAHGWVVQKTIESALKSADENLQTSDGKKFDEQVGKTFAANFSAVVAQCLKSSGEPSLFPFDLVMQLRNDGVIEKIYSSINTQTSVCVVPKMDKGVFLAPPKPDYWVKISLEPQH